MVGYEFYRNTYRGWTISGAEWPEVEARAADQLNRYKRVYAVTAPDADAESKAVCAMAEALHNIDLIVNCEVVQSASIGSVSTSYGSSATSAVDVSEKGQARALYRAACLYLDIYRGVG